MANISFTNLTGLPPEIATDLENINRRRRVQEALLTRNLQMPQTQMTGGKYSRAVPYSLGEGALKLVESALLRRAQNREQQILQDLGTRYQEGIKRATADVERQRTGEVPYRAPDPQGAALRASADPYLRDSEYARLLMGRVPQERGAYSQLAQAWNPVTKEMENVIIDTRGIPGENVYRLGGERYDQPFISPKDPRAMAEQEKQKKLGVREAEKIIARSQAETTIETEKFKLQNLDNTIDLAIDQAGGLTTTGIGAQLTSWIGGSPAGDLAGTLATLEAEAGFGRLQEMRDQSKTGGALGQVSERELELLKSAFASLKQSQSKDQLVRNLKKFKTQYRESWRKVNEAYRKDYGEYYMDPDTFGGSGKPAADAPIEDILNFLKNQ